MNKLLIIALSLLSLSSFALTNCEQSAINYVISLTNAQGNTLAKINTVTVSKKESVVTINYTYTYVDGNLTKFSNETNYIKVTSCRD